MRRPAHGFFRAVTTSWTIVRHSQHHTYHPQDLAVDNESKCPVTGKRQYATEGEALVTADHQIATANAPKGLRAYHCSWCDAWHITKNQPGPKRILRRK